MPVELKEIRRKRAKLISDARTINDLVITENRQMNEEETTRFSALTGEVESLGVDIARTETLDALERSLAEQNGDRGGNLLPHQEPRNLGKYSILRAIKVLADKGSLTGLEGEISTELAQQRVARGGRPLQANAFIIPPDLPIDTRAAARGRTRYGTAEQRAFDTTAGAGGIPTILGDYIEILRNKLVCVAAGARFMTDLTGNFALPRQATSATVYWVAEGVPITGSNPTVDQVPFTPKTCGAFTDISRRLTEQLSTDAEQFVRDDLTAVVARGVDQAALNGITANGQPLGILQNSAIPTIPIGTDGGAPSWAQIVALETSVAAGNADVGKLSYVVNPKVRGKMKTTPIVANIVGPFFLWNINSPDSPVNGYPALVSNQIPSNFVKGTSGAVCSAMIFGNWDDLVIATWGNGTDILVDPYTGSASGTIRVVCLTDVDCNVRHPLSFAKTMDITTTP